MSESVSSNRDAAIGRCVDILSMFTFDQEFIFQTIISARRRGVERLSRNEQSATQKMAEQLSVGAEQRADGSCDELAQVVNNVTPAERERETTEMKDCGD